MSKRKIKPKHKQKRSRRQQQRYDLQQEILAFMRQHPTRSFNTKQIAAEAEIWQHAANSKIRAALDKLAELGQLTYEDKGKYKVVDRKDGKSLTGKIQIFKGGYGFLLMEEGDDIFIKPRNMGKAMQGDTVKVRVLKPRRKSEKAVGEVVEVIERSRTEFVGTVSQERKDLYFLIPDIVSAQKDFYIKPDKIAGAKDGQKVVARLLNWDRRAPEVEVIRVLGEAGEHNTEMHAILHHYGFDVEFPPEVEAEVARIPNEIAQTEYARRRDMRETTTFTIDPVDAKDFDDALSVHKLENGRFEIGIHIADVSYYVKPGTKLDEEAFRRATSVYLVDRTVPMLPEKLSNNLCSLRPNEDRLAYSVVVEMDEEGKIYKEWIGRTIIHSDRRFSYEEAQEVIVGEAEGPFPEELKLLNDIAHKLRAKRFKKGSIGFETDEVRFVLDEDDKPVSVVRKVRFDAHKMIEDFMLLANKIVPIHVSKLFENPALPFVYRIHDHPDPDKLTDLQNFVKHFGHEVELLGDNDGVSEALNGLIQKVQGSPEQNLVETIAIRTMAKAIYSINNIGHFGLGFPHYSHFTSPIRRYPDLMVHRLLAEYEQKNYKFDPGGMEKRCEHCSKMERTAAEAERASIKFKQVEFLEDKIGEEFTGVVSGVSDAGIFVQLDDNLCEGLIPAWTLDDDFYVVDKQNYCLVGRDTGNKLQMGAKLRVEISGTNLQKRQIDMKLINKLETENAQA